MEAAKTAAVYYTAMADAAADVDYTLSAEAQESLDSVLASVETGWVGSYANRDAYLRSVYGPYITYDRFVELLEREALANDYAQSVIYAEEYTEEGFNNYYAEHADELDTFTLSQFVFYASAPTAAEGQEMTEEEQAAALEEVKNQKKALAEELKKRLEAGEDAEALAEEYEDELYSGLVSTQRLGSTVSTAAYGEWALDSQRKAGDVTLTESDNGSSFTYYVVRFEGRELDNTKTANVRHILVAADMDDGASEPTDAQFDAAKAKAEELLAQWESGDATEESFAMLAVTNSADSGSAADGGLLTSVSTSSGYIAEFTDWCLDESRMPGDTGIVKNTGSSIMGWHIMYYVNDGMPVWESTADTGLREAFYTEWQSEVMEGYEAVDGFGLKFL